jgi:hypothetical protein
MPLLLDSSPPTLTSGVHLLAAHGVHRQHDQAVVEQQRVAGAHVARQFLVVQAHGVDVARLGALRVQHEGLAVDQHHLAVGELADADLRALQVGHQRHRLAHLVAVRAHQVRTVDVVLRLAVAEVQPHHVDTGADQALQHLGVAGRGAEGGDDLGGARHGQTFRCKVGRRDYGRAAPARRYRAITRVRQPGAMGRLRRPRRPPPAPSC